MIRSVQSFIDYFENIRRRTLGYIRVIPADRLGWSPRDGEFTCAEIVRHLIAAEQMFVGAALAGQWRYAGHTHDPQQPLDALLDDMQASHLVAMQWLRALADADL